MQQQPKWTKDDVNERVKSAIAAAGRTTRSLHGEESLVSSLGFDSLRIASLSIELEHEFGHPLLLNDWIASYSDPRALTVASLSAYVWKNLDEVDGEPTR